MSTKNETLSPAIQLLTLVWEGTGKVGGKHSWRRLNAAMQGALDVAVASRMQFNPDDFLYIDQHFNPEYWVGDGEGYYRLAVEQDNSQAYQSYERWRGRKPFIIDEHRVYVGYDFDWDNEYLRCTSFATDGKSFVACSYEPGTGRTKVMHRHVITHDQIRSYHAAKRKKAKTTEGEEAEAGQA